MGTESKFKAGDKVRRINDNFGSISVGDVHVVKSVSGKDLKLVGDSEWTYATYNFELIAPTFAIGDRVTLTVDNEGYGEKGDAGSVIGYVDEDIRVRFDRSIRGQHDWLVSVSRLALEEKWVPKVGDRVRFTDKCSEYWWFGPQTEYKEGVVSLDHGDGYDFQEGRYEVRAGDASGIVGIEHIQPLPAAAPQPAPLTIEAGRYYKTRDGRKVGPIGADPYHKSSDQYGDGPFRTDGWNYDADGICSNLGGNDPKDLVSIWSEPTTNVGVQVDTLAEEYGSFSGLIGKSFTTKVEVSNDNAPKFKVGDRVKFRDDYPSQARGKEATVLKVNVWGTDGIQVDQGRGIYDVSTEKEADLRPVVPTPTAIVALIENGQPKPATRPYVHASEADASVEAQRLANLHKGQRFGVFVLAASTEVAKPVYDHAWKNLAAEGKKIAAIKELRSLTGMMLKPAKDVVEHFVADIGIAA